MKTSLSYSTMNALIHEPHTWLNKQMGLKTEENQYMTEGKAAHRIIQDHCSGKEIHNALLLANVPSFPIVEEEDWDKRLKVSFEIDEKYYFTGFLDGRDPEKKEMLEIKSGKAWSAGEFGRLVQWKLYALGNPDYKKVWMINVPRDPELWMPNTIKVFNKEITETDRQDARDFIQKAIGVIKDIKNQRLEPEGGRSNWCYYIGCTFCKK